MLMPAFLPDGDGSPTTIGGATIYLRPLLVGEIRRLHGDGQSVTSPATSIHCVVCTTPTTSGCSTQPRGCGG